MSGIPSSMSIGIDDRIQTRGLITNVYPCNIIHEISLGYCEPNMVRKENRLYNTVLIILSIQVITWIRQDSNTVSIKTL